MIGRSGLSLNMGAHELSGPRRPRVALDASSPDIRPANPRPTCKRCGGEWTGTHLLLCAPCEEEHLDLMADARDEQDAREDEEREDMRHTDREIVW